MEITAITFMGIPIFTIIGGFFLFFIAMFAIGFVLLCLNHGFQQLFEICQKLFEHFSIKVGDSLIKGLEYSVEHPKKAAAISISVVITFLVIFINLP